MSTRDKATNPDASPNAVRQARYAARMRANGYEQHKFWLTDREYQWLRQYLEDIRARQARAQAAAAEATEAARLVLAMKKAGG
jgi:hypothetical protein